MEFDVAVIGGGPAGCSAALRLHSSGSRVVVISKEGRCRPTEMTTPLLPSVLSSIGAERALEACAPCYGIDARWSSDEQVLKPTIADPRGHSWLVHRREFDAIMRTIVRDAGVTWLAGDATVIAASDAEISCSVGGTRVAARWFVLAAGSPSAIRCVTGQRAVVKDRLLAYWAYLPNLSMEQWLRVEATDDGWWYMVPAKSGGAFASLVTDLATARTLAVDQRDTWAQLWRATRFGTDARPDLINVSPIAMSWLPRVCGHRWVAAGDAAAKLDPLGSAGLACALDGAKRAATAVADVLRGQRATLEAYERWSATLVRRFQAGRHSQYIQRLEHRSSNFWQRRVEASGAPSIVGER